MHWYDSTRLQKATTGSGPGAFVRVQYTRHSNYACQPLYEMQSQG